MAEAVNIKIGKRSVDVSAIPLGGIRKILGAIGRAELAMRVGVLDESLLDDIVVVLSSATGIAKEELEQEETDLVELNEALQKAIKVSGLEEMLNRARGASPGEPGPGASPASTHGTSSIAASAPPVDGLGNTSTAT